MDYKQFPDISLDQLIEEKIRKPLRAFRESVKRGLKRWMRKNWLKLASLALCTSFAVQKNLNFNINFSSKKDHASSSTAEPNAQAVALNISNLGIASTPMSKSHFLFASKANTSSFLAATEILPIAEKPVIMTEKVKKQLAYVEKYIEIAQKEMKKFGIPASITLAQGLIETNAGTSLLATRNNNHFGIKCFSRRCKKGHCSNFSDDTHKDFFRIYKNAAESFRSHSDLLISKRYKHLTKLEKTNYKDWATGLKEAGYATDDDYHNKLIQLIEDLHLYKYDE